MWDHAEQISIGSPHFWADTNDLRMLHIAGTPLESGLMLPSEGVALSENNPGAPEIELNDIGGWY